MRVIIIISLALLFRPLAVLSQDIHFSQYYMNPIYLNPALTGDFEGNWRFTGNQRTQWRSVSRPYNTIALSAESKEEVGSPGTELEFAL